MWFATGLFGLVAQWLPGTEADHVLLVYGLCFFAVAWGGFSLVLGVNGWTMSLNTRAAVTASTMPLVGLALWGSGGASSYLQPVLLFTALFIGWFFPPRLAWPLVALFLCTYASPLAYDPNAVDSAFPARVLGFAVAVTGQTIAMQILKLRLVRAELVQRTFAQLDPLTEIPNRRAFDEALARADRDEERYAVVLFDLDEFKSINDLYGHPAGDLVLRSVAHEAQGVVRATDCLARIGGDEFAVIAPGAERAVAQRLVEALGKRIDTDVTFAWATFPADGPDAETVLTCADQRLLARKRESKTVAFG
jgi:diguanylate cyclase (GGDEF)-like protein